MQLAKFSIYKDKVYTTVASGEGSNTSSSPSSADRNLWGNDDTGNDMNGSMRIQGNIYVMGQTYEEDENGDLIPTTRGGEASSRAGDDPFPPSGEDGEGNLFLDGKVYSDGVETKNDIVAGGHIYIKSTHPAHSGEKKCVGELINGLDTRLTTAEGNIQTNATNISSLTQTVNNHTTQITNLTSRMDDAEDGIETNADEIANLKASSLTTDDVLQLIRDNQPSKLGAYDQPVVLFSGRARRVTYYSDKYYIEGLKLPHFSLSNSITQGLMTITITPDTGYSVNVYAVHITQERSGDSTDNIDNPWLKGRSDGAHWFESRVDALLGTKTVYIREFHNGNEDNDTWYSDNWFSDGGIKAIHLTLIGYITPPST